MTRCVRWTADDDLILVKRWGAGEPAAAIGSLLGRTAFACSKHISDMCQSGSERAWFAKIARSRVKRPRQEPAPETWTTPLAEAPPPRVLAAIFRYLTVPWGSATPRGHVLDRDHARRSIAPCP